LASLIDDEKKLDDCQFDLQKQSVGGLRLPKVLKNMI
jgi:hypothetical protein